MNNLPKLNPTGAVIQETNVLSCDSGAAIPVAARPRGRREVRWREVCGQQRSGRAMQGARPMQAAGGHTHHNRQLRQHQRHVLHQ